MRTSMRIVKASLILCAVALFLNACGSSGQNSQGVSFTLFGFFKTSAEGDGDAGQIVPLSSDPEAIGAGGVLTFYGLQNNLINTGIRTQRAFMSYYIEGASIQPPSTTQPFGTVLGPSGTTSSGSSSSLGGGTLPGGFKNIKNVVRQQAFIVPADIVSWINLNRSSLPELPFTMTVRTYVTGLTTAGDRIDSNELEYLVQFVPDNIIPPTGGTGTGSTSSASGTDTVDAGETTDGDI